VVIHSRRAILIWTVGLVLSSMSHAQQAGSISGTVYDADFDVPLADATVTIVQTGATAKTGSQGNYSFGAIDPGQYTLFFSKSGFVRHVQDNVVVTPGQVTDISASLGGDFTEMEEFIVQDIQIGADTESQLLQLRIDSPALIDSISADLMSQAGAGDAASGLRLVAGATTTEGGFAVVRGLPPRFISTQLNGVVMPSADPDTRAVQLDMFSSDVIESIQVSKTFTPDQQGAASGGAVNIVTKRIPDRNFITFSSGLGFNTQRPKDGQFLTDSRGKVKYLGIDDSRELPDDLKGLAGAPPVLPPTRFGNAGPVYGDAPLEYDWSVAGGLRHDFDNGLSVGGLATVFWAQDMSHREDAVDETRVLSVLNPGAGMIPDVTGSAATGFLQDVEDGNEQVLTSLFRKTQSKHEVTWGSLAAVGAAIENHEVGLMFMHTQSTASTAAIAEDTQGKFLKFPDHDPTQINTPGGNNDPDVGGDASQFAPFRRLESQQYVERTVQSIQLTGKHTLALPMLEDGLGIDGLFEWLAPVFDWNVARSLSRRNEPGTQFFDSKFISPRNNAPEGFQTPVSFDGTGGALGAYNVVFREIEENSTQYRLNMELPFRQWSDTEGYVKFGLFADKTTREFEQDTFTVPTDTQNIWFLSPFDGTRLSEAFNDPAQFPGQFFNPFPSFPAFERDDPGDLVATPIDFRYEGEQNIDAWYWMVDLPLTSYLKVIGGVRYESTSLTTSIESDTTTSQVFLDGPELLKVPGATLGTPVEVGLIGGTSALNANLQQEDVLPSIGIVFEPLDGLMFRAAYSETIARPTFRELTPVSQSLFFGDTPFVGNPFLKMSAVKNYDLRLDYRPFPDTLLSVSYFYKDLTDPIQVVRQAQGSNSIVIPVNFPKGQIEGWEFEARQQLGRFFAPLEGLTIGGNATLLDTEVTLRAFEADQLANAGFPTPTVPMTNAPEHLYNLFLMYDVPEIGTQVSLFYTVRGDTLVTTPGVKNVVGPNPRFFIPGVYETEYGTLNLSLTQKIGEHIKIKFAAKNLLDPKIETVYRSDGIGSDVVRTSHRNGIDLSIGISAEFTF